MIYSNLIINANVKHKTKKLLDKNIGENLYDLELHKDFLDTVAKSLFIKEQSDKLDIIKIVTFYPSKDTTESKGNPQVRKPFAIHIEINIQNI